RRSCTLPGGTSKTARAGVDVVGDGVPGTRPRKYGEPSGATAVTDTRAGASAVLAGSPGIFGAGSQTKVTRVLPLAPRSVPIQVRTTRERAAGAILDNAAVSAFGGSTLGVTALTASSAVIAQ